MAERLGFEPRARVTPRNGFRDRPYQPLWHLSAKSVLFAKNVFENVLKNKSKALWYGTKIHGLFMMTKRVILSKPAMMQCRSNCSLILTKRNK